MAERVTFIVTGGAGFVGSNLVAALLARQPRPQVVVVDSFRSGSFENLIDACDRRGVGPFDGEVIARSACELDIDHLVDAHQPAAFFHLGAITDTTLADSREMLRENVEGFRSMMLACTWRNTPLVYASSAATYGTPPQTAQRVPFPESAAGRPNNIYGFSKWLLECEHRRLAHDRAAAGEPEPWIVGLRYFNVFGPGERFKGKMASMPFQITRQVLEGKRPRIFADGSQARDQVHVDDVVACTMAAAGLEAPGRAARAPRPTPGVYNLGSGVATSFNQIVDSIRAGLGISPQERPTDYFDMPAEIRAFYQDFTCADMSAAARGLHWTPAKKPGEALAEYARWLGGSRRPTG